MNNIELYYEMDFYIQDICVNLFVAYCFVVWVRPFLRNKRKVWYVWAAYVAVMLFFLFIPLSSMGAMLVYCTVAFVTFLVMVWIDREYIAQKLFLAVTFFCVRWQAWRVVSCIDNEVFLATGYLFSPREDMFWFKLTVVRSVLSVLLGSALMYSAVKCLLWAYGCKRENMDRKEFLLLVTPSVSGVFAYGVFRFYNYVYERDSGKSPFNLYGAFDLLILVYAVICFLTIFVMTYVFRQWKNEREEDTQREVFSRQMQDLESHIKEVESLYCDIRSLRHDMGNHLMTLEQLYRQGAHREAESYARSLQDEMQDTALGVNSGNPVTDVILSGRKKEMDEKGIAFDCDFHYPHSGAVNAFDLSIILHNALSNAIEAVEREKDDTIWAGMQRQDSGESVISLSSYRSKNMYIIEVTNSYRGELKTEEENGLPVTSKAGEEHGFGLVSIRHVARKYLGDIEIGKEMYKGEERCVLRVMIQISGSSWLCI